MKHYDAVIVGCGAHGSSISYHLAKTGLKTLTIDRFSLNHSNGSSHGKTRIIRTVYAEGTSYVPMVRRAWKLWQDLEKESKTKLLQVTGGLQLGVPNSFLIAASIASAKTCSLPCRVIDPSEIKQEFPAFQPTESEIGIFDQDSGILFPERCIGAHKGLAEHMGAEFHFNEIVLGWDCQNGDGRKAGQVVVKTNMERYSASFLVLAAGPWLASLLNSVKSGLTIERQVVFWYRPQSNPDWFGAEKMPVFLWQKENSSSESLPPSLFYGIGDTGDGLKVAQSHGGEIADSPEGVRRQVTRSDELPIRNFLGECMPSASSAALVSSTTCVYTNTRDGNFILDYHPRFRNVIIASPCSGHGFKFSTVIGEIVKEMIVEGRSKSFDISLFGGAARRDIC